MTQSAEAIAELRAAAQEAIDVGAFSYHDRPDLNGDWRDCDICRAYQRLEAALKRMSPSTDNPDVSANGDKGKA